MTRANRIEAPLAAGDADRVVLYLFDAVLTATLLVGWFAHYRVFQPASAVVLLVLVPTFALAWASLLSCSANAAQVGVRRAAPELLVGFSMLPTTVVVNFLYSCFGEGVGENIEYTQLLHVVFWWWLIAGATLRLRRLRILQELPAWALLVPLGLFAALQLVTYSNWWKQLAGISVVDLAMSFSGFRICKCAVLVPLLARTRWPIGLAAVCIVIDEALTPFILMMRWYAWPLGVVIFVTVTGWLLFAMVLLLCSSLIPGASWQRQATAMAFRNAISQQLIEAHPEIGRWKWIAWFGDMLSESGREAFVDSFLAEVNVYLEGKADQNSRPRNPGSFSFSALVLMHPVNYWKAYFFE